MASNEEEIRRRFSAISDWCNLPTTSYIAGWPNFNVAHYPQPDRYVYGHHVLEYAHAEDVPAALYHASDLRTRFVGAHDIARSRGYGHGFPNFHEADYGQGVVYGTVFIPKDACYWEDAHASDLGLGNGDPTARTMDEWFRGASKWAYDRNLPAAMPNGNYAHYSDGWRCGLMVMKTATSIDIRGRELGLPDSYENYLGKPGWIEQNLYRDPVGQIIVQPGDVDLVVRTYNVCDNGKAEDIGLSPSYEVRVPQVVERFHTDWPHQIGIIGFQEASDLATGDPSYQSIPAFFGSRMGSLYNMWSAFVHEGELGILYDDEWIKDGAHQYWLLGKYQNRPWPFVRYGESHLIHVRLVHQNEGWAVSVFNTHLAPRDWPERVKARTEQLTKAIDIIKQTVRADDLPPIFMGDFNFYTSERVNYDIVNEYFTLMNEEGLVTRTADGSPFRVDIDHIWVGRSERFPTVGTLVPIRCHSDGKSDSGIDLKDLSDHSSPAVSFRIEKDPS